jgi:hypothetical protein
LSDNFASEAGHWYDEDGTPRYTYTDKDGFERKTTLRQAKEYGWFPSVSGIIDCEYKWALENWKIEQHIITADANPRCPDEDLVPYVRRVKAIRREEAAKAPDLGSFIHGCIEKHLAGKDYDQTYCDHVVAAVAAVGEWCGLDGLGIERSFAHPLGFGGKSDLHKKLSPFPGFVGDFKTKDFGEDEFPKAWGGHAMQLAAYREGFGMPNARGAIIYVSTKIPGLVRLVEVSQADLDKGWRKFCALLTYWKAENGRT